MTLGTAALPGAAVLAQAPSGVCELDRTTRELLVDSVDLIVIGEVRAGSPGSVSIEPEAYLKGPASREPIDLDRPADPGCALGDLIPGTRVLVFLLAGDGRFAWPAAPEAYLLAGGGASSRGDQPEETSEAELVAELRSLTGQYAVPADDADDGASIEWVGTVLPVGLGLLAILGISLVMLREWHRIDPS